MIFHFIFVKKPPDKLHILITKRKLCKRKDYGKEKPEGLTGTQVFDFDSSLKFGGTIVEKGWITRKSGNFL